MIDLLRLHHLSLTKFLLQVNEMKPDSKGLQITVSIYKMILEDGIKTLDALIEYLSRE